MNGLQSPSVPCSLQKNEVCVIQTRWRFCIKSLRPLYSMVLLVRLLIPTRLFRVKRVHYSDDLDIII